MDERILRRAEVERVLGISRNTFYRLRTAGHFPAGIQLSHGVTGWRLSEVQRWIAERPAA